LRKNAGYIFFINLLEMSVFVLNFSIPIYTKPKKAVSHHEEKNYYS